MSVDGKVTMMNDPHELVTVHPDGSTTSRLMSPEELARLEQQHLERYDPVTLEPRSLKEWRKPAARTSPPSSPAAKSSA